MSSESHVAFHVTSKGITRMGVSSSSRHLRAKCSGVKPLWTCWVVLGCVGICWEAIWYV